MAELNETPRGNRIHIAFFGLRNAGKSTLVNAFTGQPIAIVSDVAGTTTDPVSKAMEILPLGPCLITDTAGLDDEGKLGKVRVEKSLKVLETVDIAVWVWGDEGRQNANLRESSESARMFSDECQKRGVVVFEYRRGESVEELKKKIAAVKLGDAMPGLLDGLVKKGDRVLCAVPIDESAPKGRLILPQQQVIRECLDIGAVVTVCQPEDVRRETEDEVSRPDLVITDSQAFGQVRDALEGRLGRERTPGAPQALAKLTSFSILFARQKGDLKEYAKGLEAIRGLKDGDTVLVAEGCTHHRQCNDIGTVKIPKALERLSGRKLKFAFASGTSFPDPRSLIPNPSLIVHCGGCMLTRREMLRRIEVAKEAGIPIVNYGMVLAAVNGIGLEALEGLGGLDR